MPIKINDAARNAACDAIVDLLDAGSSAAVIRFYSGSLPATPATSPTGTLLAEFVCSDPAFGSASSGAAAIDITPALTTTGLAAGNVGYARFLDSTQAAGSGLGVFDATVTVTGGGGVVEIDNVAVQVGGNVQITGGSMTMPAS